MTLTDGRLGLPEVVRLLREDISQSEGRVTAQISGVRADLGKDIENASAAFLVYQSDHLGIHSRRQEDTDKVHKELSDQLAAMTIVEARRAGALAVVLLIVRTLGQHWQLLGVVVALVALVLGRVDINVLPPPQ